MEISPRARIRLLALGAAVLVVGAGWWLTHRKGGTSLLGSLTPSAPKAPATPSVSSTSSTTSATNAASAPTVGDPLTNPTWTPPTFDPGQFTPTLPIFGPATPPAVPSYSGAPTAPSSANGTPSPKVAPAHPRTNPGFSPQQQAAAATTASFASVLDLGFPLFQTATYQAPYVAGVVQGVTSGQDRRAAIGAAQNALGWWNTLTEPIRNAIVQGQPDPTVTRRPIGQALAPIQLHGGTPNNPTSAAQLAHRGQVAPVQPGAMRAPAQIPTLASPSFTPAIVPARSAAQVSRTRARAVLN